ERGATGIQPGIKKGDRKRRLQGFEVLLAKAEAKTGASDTAADTATTAAASATSGDEEGNSSSDNPSVAAAISAHRGREAARDKRPRGGLAPSLVRLLWEHQLPAALAAGVAAAALASEKEAAAAAMVRAGGDAAAAGGVGGAGAGGERSGGEGGEEGPASVAAALVFAAVRQVTLRLLRGAGDPLSGALVFAGQPRSMAALAYALDPSSLVTPVGPEGSATMEALADGLDETLVTPGGTARLLVRSCQALSAADLALSSCASATDAVGGPVGGASDAGGGGGGGGSGGAGGVAFLSGGAEGDMTAALRKLHELGPSLAGRSSACEVICRHALSAVVRPPPGAGRAAVTVTTSLLLWVLEGDQESCSDVLAERWGSLRSRVSTLAGEVGWADSLSHRLYLFSRAMEMVSSDRREGGGPGDKRKGKWGSGSGGGRGGGNDLPRAGEMMTGLARQSQTLAVYIGLEDAPDASDAPSSDSTATATGATTDDRKKPPAPALQPRTEEERRRAAAPVIVALTLRLKVLALAASRGLGASYPAFAGGAAVPALAGLVEILAFGLAKAGANRALAHRVRLARAGRAAPSSPSPPPPPPHPTPAAVPVAAPEPAPPQPPRLKDPSKEPLLLVGDLFTTPGPGEAEEAELRWELEDGGRVSEQRGLEVGA
ncbi:unnamed protein product, partial [Laminaria digitata]